MDTKRAFLAVIFSLLANEAGAAEIELVLPPTSISPTGDRSVFATPMDYSKGHLVVAHVVPPSSETTPGYVSTVIRHGQRGGNGLWNWRTSALENTTLLDPYHTQPSVAIDKAGYIHATYNMHHVPWQYVISKQPFDITNFAFRGDRVSREALDMIRLQNKTHFPEIGGAMIPGNQITYPAFFKDQKGDLLVSYRFAMRPALAWEKRAYAIGIAKYSVDTRTWQSLGTRVQLNRGDAIPNNGEVPYSYPFIYDDHYLPYLVTLAFDANNAMHAIWTWWDRKGGVDGSITVRPSYRYVADASSPASAMDLNHAVEIPGWPGGTVFNTAKSIAIAENGDVLAIFEPQGRGGRQLIRRLATSGEWGNPVDTPNSASKIRVSKDGTEWLFASGLNLFRRSPGGVWSKAIPVGRNLCDPWPLYVAEENTFYIHAKSCTDFGSAVIYRYTID